jgi:hypothetical protein
MRKRAGAFECARARHSRAERRLASNIANLVSARALQRERFERRKLTVRP